LTAPIVWLVYAAAFLANIGPGPARGRQADHQPEPDMIVIRSTGLYFTASASCGCVWQGMRHSDDVRIVVDRAVDHGRCDVPSTAVDDVSRETMRG
jgi:hypothetical protein